MPTFRISLRRDYGYLSVEGSDENELLANLQLVQSLESKVDEALGFDIVLPPSANKKLEDLGYIERILVLLYYSPRPLSKPDCRNRTRVLKMPPGWWNGSNFTRDLDRLPEGLVETVNENGVAKYSLTSKGKDRVKLMIKAE
ncbi:MAG: hypothetical protein ACREBU_01905 [Nitrososphaera sp.]